ncbi:MAG: hypothetical protein WDN69_16195 [Aliidongia sp.]
MAICRQPSFAALSPSGQQIAFIAVNTDSRRLVLKGGDGSIGHSWDVGTSKVRKIDWVGEDHIVLELSTTDNTGHGDWGETETPRTIVLNAKTNQTFIPFLRSTDVLPTTSDYYGSRCLDGHQYGYFESVSTVSKSHPITAMYRVDLDTGNYQLISAGSKIALASDGSILATAQYSMPGSKWTLSAGTTDGRTLLSVNNPLGDYKLLGLGRKPGTILVARSDQPDGTLWEWSVGGNDAPVSLTTDPDVGAIHGPDGLAAAWSSRTSKRVCNSSIRSPTKKSP